MRWPKRTESQRYFEKVDRRGLDECWPWLAATDRKGYGVFRRFKDGRWVMYAAHRFAYEIATDHPPGTLLVCHTCDNPPCQNPAHLFLGTAQRNLDDMRAKGRGSPPPPGWNRTPANAKLRPEDVIAIRERFAHGELQRVIAEDYGIDQVNVSCIVTGKSWRHLPFPS